MKAENPDYWRGKNYAFFCHKTCEAFPCHEGLDPERFNCLFCYCPLYALGEKCKGNYSYTERGIKSCGNCVIPHDPENYGYIIGRFEEIAKLAEKTL
ncbi:MAG: cysteine-rich small domain-containing protein [Oscillospiraceae bacterium]|jgi:Zn-finger protein|nr:cysteine-rich small domain-containing protein [Oscillospiraceae bacterium]